MAPRRPAVYTDQWPLVAVSLLALAGGVIAVVLAVFN
ncbi:MAG: hypothetical protein QOG68_2521 [Solirubrobacteraceae bacterium]|jgi:hypothetical protein|nr:hypothetical protein [Solirubrobacteraceae bacterium]